MSLLNGYRKTVVFVLLSVSHSLTLGEPAPMFELPYGKTHMTRNWGESPATARKEWKFSVQQSKRNWILPTATEVSRDVTPPSDELQRGSTLADTWVLLCAALSQRRPAKLCMYSWHTSCETVFVVLEKLRMQEQILNIASNVFPLVHSFWPSDNLLKEAKLLFEKWKFNCHFPIEIFKLLPIAVGFWVLRT